MRKIVFVLSSLIILFFFTYLALKPSEFKYDGLGLEYKEIELKRAIKGVSGNEVYLVKRAGNTNLELYKPIHTGEHVFGDRNFVINVEKKFIHLELANVEPEKKEQVFNMANLGYWNELKSTFQAESTDTLTVNYEDRTALFANVQDFEGRTYWFIDKNFKGWFDQLDNSFLIFFLIALIPFSIMLLHDFILYLTNTQRQTTKYFIIQMILCSLVISFFYLLFRSPYYAASPLTQLILLLLVFVPTYLIFQWELKHLKGWTPHKLVEESYKFVLLFATLIVLIHLANECCIWIDRTLFNSDGITTIADRGRSHVEGGFAFSFALGNLLNNLRKYFWDYVKNSRNQNRKLKVTENKVLASESQLNAIQASVNPHFLYNSLNSIVSLAKIDADKTEKMALALSKFYKYHTNRSGEPLISITDEIEMIKTYLEIEKIRFGERLQYNIEVEDAVKNLKIPHFLLQPLVENAVKYGYNEQTENIDVKLKISKKAKDLIIELYDKGKAFDENLSSGYGLKSVQQKLKLLFPDKYELDFVNEPQKHIAIRISDYA